MPKALAINRLVPVVRFFDEVSTTKPFSSETVDAMEAVRRFSAHPPPPLRDSL